MPRISQFYGISIYMYYGDHPPPHLHAIYAGHESTVDIRTGTMISGDLPRRAAKLVEEWRAAHANELMDNWQRAEDGQPLIPIDPLE
jgi:hypothetical protein